LSAAAAAAKRFTAAASAAKQKQDHPGDNDASLNNELRATEGDFLSAAGLPNRPWFKHTIYAPGEYTGYAAVVIPGVNEAIDAKDSARAQSQLTVLTEAINRAADTLEKAAK
jgi:N-acetylated-alpha-linked acidic dipeptidase